MLFTRKRLHSFASTNPRNISTENFSINNISTNKLSLADPKRAGVIYTNPSWAESYDSLEEVSSTYSADNEPILAASAGILDLFPQYADTYQLDTLRATEYAYLDEQKHCYLDYTGAGLASRSQFQAHFNRLNTMVLGNPHSVNPTSHAATELVEQTRAKVLRHLNASPEEYTIIFTPNASGAIRLVGESYPWGMSKRYVLTNDNHNSINGIREFAKRGHSRVTYIPASTTDLRVSDAAIEAALRGGSVFTSTSMKGGRRGLFAYPAQSNFSGVKHPLEWVTMAQKLGYHVLLDTAAYLPTNSLDLSGPIQPDFLSISWYKLFGYPTGVGCLVAKKSALACLSRPWFSGGSVKAVTVGLPWHRMARDEAAFEDGTINFQSIPDISVGLDWISRVGINAIQTRVSCLTGYFLYRLLSLRHSDFSRLAIVYGPTTTEGRGGTVAFNIFDAMGSIVDERIIDRDAAQARISLRTGCFCNPGAGEDAFALDTRALKSIGRDEDPEKDEVLRLLGMPTGGAIRVSFGIASTAADVDRCIAFIINTYQDRRVLPETCGPR